MIKKQWEVLMRNERFRTIWKRVSGPLKVIALLYVLGGVGSLYYELVPDEEPKGQPPVMQTSDRPSEPAVVARTTLSGCRVEDVKDFTINTVSWEDAGRICEAMRSYLVGSPRIDAFRKLQQGVSLLQSGGYDLPAKDIAEQYLKVVQLRRQASNSTATLATIDTVFKIFNGTSGAIPPSRVVTILQVYGADASQLTDEGLVKLVVAAGA